MEHGDPWVLDELAHAGPEHLDAAYVAGYDTKSAFDPAPDLASLQAHGLDSDATLVDLGAGTGRLTLAAAAVCRRVVAVDVSPAMLATLGQAANDAGLTNVECVHAGFLTYEPHRRSRPIRVHTARARIRSRTSGRRSPSIASRACCEPGGILLLRDLDLRLSTGEAASVFGDWFDNAETDPARGYTRADFVEHIRTEHSTFRWLFEPMLTAAGFEILDVEFTRRTYARYLCRNAREVTKQRGCR